MFRQIAGQPLPTHHRTSPYTRARPPTDSPKLTPLRSFEIDDAEDTWVFSQPFDLIHGRALATCFSTPQTVITSAAAALAPGGWLEFQDLVIPIRCLDDSWAGSAIERWTNMLVTCAARVGRDSSYSQRYPALFRAAPRGWSMSRSAILCGRPTAGRAGSA